MQRLPKQMALKQNLSFIKVLSHIGSILSRVGYVVLTFCPENQTDGSYRYCSVTIISSTRMATTIYSGPIS